MATIVRTEAGTWKAIIRRKRRGIPLLARTFAYRDTAASWARKTESEIERGIYLLASKKPAVDQSMTLGEALSKWAEDVEEGHKGAAVESDVIDVLKQYEPLCREPFATVTASQVLALRNKWLHEKYPVRRGGKPTKPRKGDGYAVSTVNRRIGMLRALYTHARKKWKIPIENPCVELHLKGEVERDRRVSDMEINAILEGHGSSDVIAACVVLAVETAMRRGEIASLHWEWIDLAKSVVRLPERITKNGRARVVPLSPAALRTFQTLGPKSEGRIFQVDPHSVTVALRRAVARARADYEEGCEARGVAPDARHLVDLHFHDLRHEACSRLAKIFKMHELMKIVGHRTPAMLARYYHPEPEEFAARLKSHGGVE